MRLGINTWYSLRALLLVDIPQGVELKSENYAGSRDAHQDGRSVDHRRRRKET